MKETVEEAKERAANYMRLKGALEVKEETLEEAGAEYQATQMYSEEEVLTILKSHKEFIVKELKGLSSFKNEKEWFEQFKKKKVMKNIHILPTEKPSYLYKMSDDKLRLSDLLEKGSSAWTNQHIYITSDEEIKEGDWMYYKHFREDIVCKYDTMNGQNTNVNEHKPFYQKIILTTYQDLIKDGIQAIDDKFLEWFVKNSNCEFVEIKSDYVQIYPRSGRDAGGNEIYDFIYKIIIPQEKPKTYSCCGRCNGVDDICILDREEAKQRAANYMSLKGALEPKQETPESWVILKLPNNHYKVFGTWAGGYLDGDRWKLNSGIEKVEQEDDYYYFTGFSGSCYKCHKKGYGTATSYGLGILNKIIEEGNGQIELMEDSGDWSKDIRI